MMPLPSPQRAAAFTSRHGRNQGLAQCCVPYPARPAGVQAPACCVGLGCSGLGPVAHVPASPRTTEVLGTASRALPVEGIDPPGCATWAQTKPSVAGWRHVRGVSSRPRALCSGVGSLSDKQRPATPQELYFQHFRPPDDVQSALRYAYGGPRPFGTDAIAICEHFSPVHDPLAAAEEARAQDAKAARQALWALIRSPRASLEDLPEEGRAYILRERAKLRFRKFWGLMNETDRPWHYDTIVYLCSALQPDTSARYRAVKPSTMQRILAQRAKVEKAIHVCRSDINQCIGRVGGWVFQVTAAGRALPRGEVEALGEAVLQIRALLGSLDAEVQRLQKSARGTYRDDDYCAYGDVLLEEIDDYIASCKALREGLVPYLLQYDSVLRDAMQRSGGSDVSVRYVRQEAEEALGPVPQVPARLSPLRRAVWRYPPRPAQQRRQQQQQQQQRAENRYDSMAGEDRPRRGGRYGCRSMG